MRLNAQTMSYHEHQRYMIRDAAGNDINYCFLLDTDEGYAECAFAVPSGFKTEDDILRLTPLRSFDEYNQEWVFHTYTLHTFELWDIIDNVLVAKV